MCDACVLVSMYTIWENDLPYSSTNVAQITLLFGLIALTGSHSLSCVPYLPYFYFHHYTSKQSF